MPAVKSVDQSSAKWLRSAQAATQEYAEGVTNPKKDWATETGNANEAYKAGIQKAVADDRFKKGVSKAGTSKWQKGAVEKGVQRWAPGIATAQQSYEEGVKPYLDVIARTQLPKRGPKGDAGNIQRVAILSAALHAEKLKRKS